MSSPGPGNPTTQTPSHQHKQSSPIPQHSQPFRSISRNNSNTSTASSSNRGEFSSTISTTNSIASSKSQISRPPQLVDHRQLLATCGASSTPIRSFQRATISSVVKTRAFDNNPVLQGLLAPSPSTQNSVSNSRNSSPLSTPVFSRSRSLRMSTGPRRYQANSHHFRNSSRTPEIFSFNDSGDISSINSQDSQSRIRDLHNEKSELKESLEFLECERQVLIDSAKELRETLQKERSQWKKEQDELKKQLTDAIAARVRAESQLTKIDVDMNDSASQFKKMNDELQAGEKQMSTLKKNLDVAINRVKELEAYNEELKKMLSEKLKFNSLSTASNCVSIVTEMAMLRLELNKKDEIIESLGGYSQDTPVKENNTNNKPHCDVETLNRFLDQTVECIKGWPEELAGSSHVQNLMKTLLSAYRPDHDDLILKVENLHL